MININAFGLDFDELNEKVRSSTEDCTIDNCLGQRFIATGLDNRNIKIKGIAGNALGSYLNGANVIVEGNAQDAVGDTMNDGKIIIHGNIGDAAGYSMRGGKIFVRDDAGYRAGIHMKEYKEKIPVMVIGGKVGSFLGEYQSGGIIIVLGLTNSKSPITGNFPCTGMHGGKILFRSDCKDIDFPPQVCAKKATEEDIDSVNEYLLEFCSLFNYDINEIKNSSFTLVTPDSSNPYRQMYVAN